jgi:hypothetical protein
MEQMYLLYIPFVIGALVFLFFFFNIRRKTKRHTVSLKEVSVRMGLSMSSEEYPFPLDELKKLHFFSGGVNESFDNIMKGSKHSFNTQRDEDLKGPISIVQPYPGYLSSIRLTRTVFLFQSTQLNLPHFRLRPLNTTAGVKFHQFPKFSLQYYLACSEEEQIRSVFNTKVLSFFENRNHKFLSAEGLDTLLLFYKTDMKIAPEEIREYFEEAHTIAQAFLQTP